ncbi:uncharacterized protein [Leptinotarsa decemlineata]|uniref:uncharacterized protein n=1 Tax=Leptinotarsa decemlineata TaxID=7539 RepID=UPI003D307AD6
MNSKKINEVLTRLSLEDENNWFSDEEGEVPNNIIEGEDGIIEVEDDFIEVVDDVIVEEEEGEAMVVARGLEDVGAENLQEMDPEDIQDEGIDDDPATDNGNVVLGSKWMNVSDTVEDRFDLYCVTDSHVRIRTINNTVHMLCWCCFRFYSHRNDNGGDYEHVDLHYTISMMGLTHTWCEACERPLTNFRRLDACIICNNAPSLLLE